MDVKSVGGSFYYDNFAFPGMVPYKRAATDKSGVPVYQPGATTYQQLMTLQQQPYVPVTCEYTQVSTSVAPPLPNTTAANNGASALIVSSAASSSPTPTPAILPALAAPSGGSSPAPTTTASPQQQHQQTAPQSQQQLLGAATIPEQENGTDEDNENNNKSAQILAAAAATQNYFQSVKLASSPPNSSTTISPLTALSYTGVALNKQLLSPPQPRLSYAAPATPQSAFSQQQQLLMRANQSAQMMQTNFSYLTPFMAQQRLLVPQQMVNPFAMLQQTQAPQPHHHPNFVPSTPLHHFHPYAHPLAAQQSLGSSQQQAMAAAAANAAAALSYKKMKSI
ncbi:hypothetical protein B566_EDAN008651 [Ephemera danica]|nr:hypothetical protein B566_EDAN008651 [Ephemera danica]